MFFCFICIFIFKLNTNVNSQWECAYSSASSQRVSRKLANVKETGKWHQFSFLVRVTVTQKSTATTIALPGTVIPCSTKSSYWRIVDRWLTSPRATAFVKWLCLFCPFLRYWSCTRTEKLLFHSPIPRESVSLGNRTWHNNACRLFHMSKV